MDNNPASEANNKHHTDTGYKSQDEFLDELLGRGRGDPDAFPIPDEDTDIA